MICLNKIARLLLLTLLSLAMPALPALAASEDWDRVLDILDARTAFRWGEDNLAWVVHYPAELVEPWVAAQTGKSRMTPAQAAEFRKSFTEELRIGKATALMLSVHNFSLIPATLAPLAKNVALIDSSGKRVAPIVFEKKLEGRLSGLTQGFIFFPLQKDDDFRVAITGLTPGRETIFAFGAGSGGGRLLTEPLSRREPASRDVVVRIPTAPQAPKEPEKSAPPAKEPEYSLDAEVFPPYVPPPALPPAGETPPTEEDSSPLFSADTAPESEPASLIADASALPPAPAKKALDTFLRAWADGDSDKMYGLLCEESRVKISRELFKKEVLAAGGFRQGLREGYKVSWQGNTANVTVAQRVLLVRTLATRKIEFVEENGAYRVAW